VVVGFFNDDPRRPVILGALFGSKNAPPGVMGKPSGKNDKKGIVTKLGTTIQLLDIDKEKTSVTIETAKHNKLVIDDDAKSILLADQHGNSITMGKDGIEITSGKDLSLTIEGKKKVTITGKEVDVK
jgi:uncharacterized protein involved in type VI secretion and phage assembly